MRIAMLATASAVAFVIAIGSAVCRRSVRNTQGSDGEVRCRQVNFPRSKAWTTISSSWWTRVIPMRSWSPFRGWTHGSWNRMPPTRQFPRRGMAGSRQTIAMKKRTPLPCRHLSCAQLPGLGATWLHQRRRRRCNQFCDLPVSSRVGLATVRRVCLSHGCFDLRCLGSHKCGANMVTPMSTVRRLKVALCVPVVARVHIGCKGGGHQR